MRIANVDGRASIIVDDSAYVDIAEQSSGRFGPDPRSVLEDWAAFREWSENAELGAGRPLDPALLRAPVDEPRQVFAIGMNYLDHADEIGSEPPQSPSVFTKYLSCLSGPYEPIRLIDGSCDWEVEVVAVVGRHAYQVPAERGWDHVAGLTVGQDISERSRQTAGPMPQFSLAKSFPTFGPIGPWLVAADSLPDRDRLTLGCSVNGEIVQSGSTADLVFSIPELISRLSHTLPLMPGDLIFTGTPAGVGAGRSPQRFLQPGDVVESWVGGIGRMRNVCVAEAGAAAAPVVAAGREPVR
ncbi:fumarylacetoacetate hydrolase family protein [Nonomuraea wenchangensis]|uniref:2-keto-4-pentenoate hydratase/2-oxohepta-3-ene-1,7-dioic acid hydratase (Catechol pathway) n=1 Tax=Nonomuraea wenchangensis TaxID=568860 RepID=A0A1I0HV86_9ACTN|nr:fumarylacetoacetate hydrolase family protein [Nonomuraea wenchangensis]SET87968.1 2-keto-4-pentenoate hydratase/2-oxohepta-3-ene-1,7-dioic acid hydratase (catechol pathway) [Nonomuraea wenchangensis]